MTKLRTFIASALLACTAAGQLAIPAAADDDSPRKTIGLTGGYVSRNTTAYAGVYMRYRFSRVFALKPQVDFVVRHNQTDAYLVCIDGNFSIPIGSDRWNLYGIAGAGFSSWSIRELTDDGLSYDRRRHGNLAIDAGAGIAVNATSTLRLALEAKGNFVTRYSTALIGLSIGYNF